jgi:hypothetical protein
MDVDELAALLPAAKPARRGGFVARCPAHEDEAPSLSIQQGNKGVVVHCFAGCSTDDVMAALGRTTADLFNDDPGPVVVGRRRRHTTVYEIRDFDGTLRAIHERTDHADGSKAFAWRQPNGASGLNGTGVVDLPLYGSERIASWPPDTVPLVVEGEKDARALLDAGVAALGTITGAASTPSALPLGALTGRGVILAPDNDDAGRQHMQRTAATLAEFAAVGWVEWPGVPAKGGAADYLATHTADDVRQLVTTAQAWPLDDETALSAQRPNPLGKAGAPERPQARPASDIDPAVALRDPWRIEGVLRPGRLLVLASQEGVGKSYGRGEMAVRLATQHGALFGHYPIAGRARVLLFDVENGEEEETRREEEILERLELDRAGLTDYWRVSLEGLLLTDADDQLYVRDQIELAHPDVVVFDTGSSMVGEEWGTELKLAVRFLRALAREYGCSIVVCVHLVKPSRQTKRKDAPEHGTDLSDVMGQWTRQADSVALMARTKDDMVVWSMLKRVPHSVLILAPDSGTFRVVSAVSGGDLGLGTRDLVAHYLAQGVTDTDTIAKTIGITRRTVQRHVAKLSEADVVVSSAVATDVAMIPEREATASDTDVADDVAEQVADVATLSPPPIGGRPGDMSPPAGRDGLAAGFAAYLDESSGAAWDRLDATRDKLT